MKLIKSFCIKSNNEKILNYLLENFEKINLSNLFISMYNFKIYKNIIVHYSGDMQNDFIDSISKTLSKCIIHFYEKKIIKRIFLYNYFYFTEKEQKIILSVFNNIKKTDLFDITMKNNTLENDIKNYITDNKSMILDGFVNFRIKDYMEILESFVDTAVNNYVIEKEYIEFINLLKLFIHSKPPLTETIHLIYHKGSSILLDEKLNIINTENTMFKTPYLSDITFSSNDYALNTLLNLLPQKIYIHIIDKEDEFINTLKLIFEEEIILCKECNICDLYGDK